MNTEQYINSLKAKYQKLEAPMHLRESGWEELSKRLEPAPFVTRRFWLMRFAFVTGILLLVSGGFFGFYKIASASLPGDFLYPVKRFSERVSEKATGNNQTAIDNRAQEIVTLAQQKEVRSEELKQTVQEYTQNVTQRRTEIHQSGQTSSEFQQKLDEQHKEFDQVIQQSPSVESDIKDAQKVSEHSDSSEHQGRD